MFGFHDAARSGASHSITDEVVDGVVVKTLEETPGNATRWSIRSMVAAVGMSPCGCSSDLVGVRFETSRLVEEFEVSPVPRFVDEVRDITGLYSNPLDAAVVLCVERENLDTGHGSHPSRFCC